MVSIGEAMRLLLLWSTKLEYDGEFIDDFTSIITAVGSWQ
jgi:hypothetical protein